MTIRQGATKRDDVLRHMLKTPPNPLTSAKRMKRPEVRRLKTKSPKRGS